MSHPLSRGRASPEIEHLLLGHRSHPNLRRQRVWGGHSPIDELFEQVQYRPEVGNPDWYPTTPNTITAVMAGVAAARAHSKPATYCAGSPLRERQRMRGRVLGFDGANGAIAGDDGQRYSFARVSWKGDRLPQARDTVDFVVAADAATDIYPVRSSLGATLGQLGESAVGEKLGTAGVRMALAERPQVAILGVVILASLLLGFISGGLGMELTLASNSISLVSFPSVVGDLRSQMSQLDNNLGGEATTGNFGAVSALAYLLWFIPVGAVFLLFRDITGKRMRTLELTLGALCVASFGIYRLSIGAIRSMLGDVGGGLIGSAVSFGLGGYVIVLCGIALIFTGLGRLTRTPGP